MGLANNFGEIASPILYEGELDHELYVGVYDADSMDTAYYDTYNPIED